MNVNMRLALGAVGQLASPLQSFWVMMQVQQSLQQTMCGKVTVGLVKSFHLYRSWLLARAGQFWGELGANFVATPTLEQALLWKPLQDAPIQQLVNSDRSIEQCLEQVECIRAELEAQSANLGDVGHGLTVTQVAIPSQSEDESEGETCEHVSDDATTSAPKSDSEDNHQVLPPGTPDNGMCVVTIHWIGEPMSIVRVPAGTSMADVIAAEQDLTQQEIDALYFTDFHGTELSADHVVQADSEWVAQVAAPDVTPQPRHLKRFESVLEQDPFESPLTRVKGKGFLQLISPKVSAREQVHSLRAQRISSDQRAIMLVNQELVWGDDEVLWHLMRVVTECNRSLTSTEKLMAWIDPLFVVGWIHLDSADDIREWYEYMDSPKHLATAVLHAGHWTPVVVRVQNDEASTLVVSFQISSEQDRGIVHLLAKKLQEALQCKSFRLISSTRDSDIQCCGAAAVLYLEEHLLLQETPAEVSIEAVHEKYRDQFQAQLAEIVLAPHPWMWGAGNDDTKKAVDALIGVLKDHGVPSDCLQSRAQQAVAAIGGTPVLQACSSKAPWRNLKALGTNVKFQFVLPSELQQQIEKRAGQEAVGKPLKKTKGNKPVKQDESPVLDPAKLSLPEGLFSCGGKPVEQLTLQQVGPVAEGVAVVTALEAEPFLRSGKLIAKGPLALLVLNAPSARIVTVLPTLPVTVPARCVVNHEPLLLEATLVQIGGEKIEKTPPKTNLELESVKVSTLKLVAFRDEILGPWDQFVQGPVKYIIHHFAILKLCCEPHCKCKAWHNEENEKVQSAVIDVWRRQFMRKGYKPEPPATAIMFSVCIRVPECIRDRVLALSGVAGTYVEPRSLDAREVDKLFEVVWVPRADRALVMHLKQTNPAASSIARSDDRWGLRTLAAQASALHASIRPDAVYLSQGPRLKFTIGPVPYGTDRRSLSKALKAFGWDVEPIQPTGAVDGGRGNVWLVHSTEQPATNIINLGHGDMVIATVDAKHGVKDEQMKPVAAPSTLTLCGSAAQAPLVKDPWTVRDPWQSYQPTSVDGTWMKSVPEPSESLKQLESKIEQAVLSKLPAHQALPMEQDDVPDRVDVLEKQVQSLMQKQQQMETTMQEQHIHQSAQLTQLQGQINAQGQQVTGQLTSQQQQMQQMFEAQMNQIRSLLSKRPREDGEWLDVKCEHGRSKSCWGVDPLEMLDSGGVEDACQIDRCCSESPMEERISTGSCQSGYDKQWGITLLTFGAAIQVMGLLSHYVGWSKSFGFGCIYLYATLVGLLTSFRWVDNRVKGNTWRGTQVTSMHCKLQVQTVRVHHGMGLGIRHRVALLVLCLLHSGEAINPGPSTDGPTWTLGTFNPSGLNGKHQILTEHLAYGDIWAIAETHLSSRALQTFRKGLSCSQSPFKFVVGGFPAPVRKHSQHSGAWTGVATISRFPTRQVPVAWPDDVFQTSRTQVVTTLCHDMWISGGIVYGEPPGVQHPEAKMITEQLLSSTIDAVLQLRGCRYVAGDWNFQLGQLEAFDILERHGFKDLQTIACERWGTVPQPTCKAVTRKDFLYVSPEMRDLLIDVKLEHDVWSDHSVLAGVFKGGPSQIKRFHWRMPRSFPWPADFHSQQLQLDVDFQYMQPTEAYTELWAQVEAQAAQQLEATGANPVQQSTKGRGATLQTVVKCGVHNVVPLKQSRKGDVVPGSHGASVQHAHWFRQLRRLQAYCRYVKMNPHDEKNAHGAQVWRSILQAKGFGDGFKKWWKQECCTSVMEAPTDIPLVPPSLPVAEAIYASFQVEVRKPEHSLQQRMRKHGIKRREEQATLVFKDIKAVPPARVDVLLNSQQAIVLDVCPTDLCITLDKPLELDWTRPCVVNGKQLETVYAEAEWVYVTDISDIQPLQTLTQTCFLGNTEEMFQEFEAEWTKRWNRHRGVSQAQWENIIAFAQAEIPFSLCPIDDINPEQLLAEVARKKKHSATGPDGVSLLDIQSMPHSVLQKLCDMLNRAEKTGEWPQQTVIGKVASLAKTETPDKVSLSPNNDIRSNLSSLG